jgi:hypothetical protein
MQVAPAKGRTPRLLQRGGRVGLAPGGVALAPPVRQGDQPLAAGRDGGGASLQLGQRRAIVLPGGGAGGKCVCV